MSDYQDHSPETSATSFDAAEPADEASVGVEGAEHALSDDAPMSRADLVPDDNAALAGSTSSTLEPTTIPAEPDVDAALNALSSLNVLAADAPREAFRPDEVTLSEALPQPPLATLERGTAASVVPALLLIGAGVFMTFYLASGNPMPATQHLVGGGLIVFGLSLVAWWWDTQRWARGSLLVGVLCIAGGAALFVL